ncbi:hypothetical protein [Streptomyces chartreusis]|uniref:hypothetical protein n=1 Tax=Streptomyces chartreusis TaxID=1969 RepID=UPI0038681B0F|nr:hypothetical protein OG938_48535 [Streptomyces chartreusis]
MFRDLLRRLRQRPAGGQRTTHTDSQLRESADIAITSARRTLARRMPLIPAHDWNEGRARVDVQDVLDTAREHFGLTDVDRARAAAVLRARYELRTGPLDLDTDAYDC